MIFRKTAGIVIFKKEEEVKFLLLEAESVSKKVKKTIWSLPKGNVEEGEENLAAALRETEEETGIKKEELKIIEGFKKEEKYFYKENDILISKTAHYFLAEYIGDKEITLSFEHINFKWATLKEAFELIKFKNIRQILQDTETFRLGTNI